MAHLIETSKLHLINLDLVQQVKVRALERDGSISVDFTFATGETQTFQMNSLDGLAAAVPDVQSDDAKKEQKSRP